MQNVWDFFVNLVFAFTPKVILYWIAVFAGTAFGMLRDPLVIGTLVAAFSIGVVRRSWFLIPLIVVCIRVIGAAMHYSWQKQSGISDVQILHGLILSTIVQISICSLLWWLGRLLRRR